MSLKIIVSWIIITPEPKQAENSEKIVDEEIIDIYCTFYNDISVLSRLCLDLFLARSLFLKDILLLRIALLLYIVHCLLMHLCFLISRISCIHGILLQFAFVILFILVFICISSKPFSTYFWHCRHWPLCRGCIVLFLTIEINIGVLS